MDSIINSQHRSEMCHQSGAVLRASDQLCPPCWCGTGSPSKQVISPPSCLESEENENHEQDVDHSFRFSTPSMFTQSKIESEDNKKILPSTLTEPDGPATSNQEDYTKSITTPPYPHQSSSLEQRPINPPHLSPNYSENETESETYHGVRYTAYSVAGSKLSSTQDSLPSLIIKAIQESRPTKSESKSAEDCVSSNTFDCDNLISNIAITTCQKTGKENCKFYGNAEELERLIKHVLKLEGNWSITKDLHNHKIFKTDSASISWWNSTKTLSISGKKEDDLRKTLRSLCPFKCQENNKDSDPQNKAPDKLQTSSNFPNDQSNVQPDITSRYHQEIKNIWSAIHSLFTTNLQKGSDILSLVKHEREINHSLNEELRAMLNENNSLKARISSLNDKIKDLESTIEQYQNTDKWEKPRKTAPPKVWIPPTWKKVDIDNKYNTLLELNSENDSDPENISANSTTSGINSKSNSHPQKLSYEGQLHTVHLQRKINYLQLKLKEKSVQSQPYEDPPEVKLKVNEEKETKCNLPPTAPWPQKTKSSNNQNSYTGKPKDNNIEKDAPNPPIRRKQQPKDKPSKQDLPNAKGKIDVIIAGDSILNHIEGPRLSNRRRHTKVHSFSGASTEDMIDFIKPLAYRNPDYLIIHAGTNDLGHLPLKDTLMNYNDIVDIVKQIDPKIKVIFSSVTQRFDNDKLEHKVAQLNRELKAFCGKSNLGFIDNSNISKEHVGSKGLHLNGSGKARLALNFKETMNSL